MPLPGALAFLRERNMPRLLISALHKSSGKTTITLGLCAALKKLGLVVQPFKKGPDYIDPMWLGQAAGKPCYNLDFQTQDKKELLNTFNRYPADIRIIEGNMGLFDSIDVEGQHSNAALATVLQTPVILVVNVLGMTRSVVPIILGYQNFDPDIRIAGVILNNVAGARHEKRLREVFAHYLDLPLLGCIHRDPGLAISERHLGLVSNTEMAEVDAKLEQIADTLARQVDLQMLLEIARSAPPLAQHTAAISAVDTGARRVRIGIARDRVFGFYYPDDLERLQAAGAELVTFDTLTDPLLPDVDALLIGGGFPETHMHLLSANRSLRNAIADAIRAGMPAYAECGGLMYLARSIQWHGEVAEMVGILPGDAVMHDKPQGRGYVRLRETPGHPWRTNAEFREFPAHEFHYSRLQNLDAGLTYAYEVLRGAGIDGTRDGLVCHNLLASYMHLRDVDGYCWTGRFVDFIRRCHSGAGNNGK